MVLLGGGRRDSGEDSGRVFAAMPAVTSAVGVASVITSIVMASCMLQVCSESTARNHQVNESQIQSGLLVFHSCVYISLGLIAVVRGGVVVVQAALGRGRLGAGQRRGAEVQVERL
jgi:hypothetical protein